MSGDDEQPEGPEGPDPQEIFAGAMMELTSTAIELSTLKLATMARQACDVGVATMFCACLGDDKNPENKNKAFVFLFSGDLPDDLVDGLDNYCRAVVQDYTNGNKNLRVIKSYDSANDNP